MNSSDLNQIFIDKGGVLEITSENLILLSFIDEYERIYNSLKIKYPNLPKPHFCFINNLSFNAYARKVNDIYFIGINIGAIGLLLDLFYKLLSNKSVLTNYGNINLESNETNIINRVYNNGVSFSGFSSEDDISPNCPTRFELATNYIKIAFTFLIFHEFGHIIRGHLKYKAFINESLNSTWNEFNYSNNDKENLNIPFSQTLEMDADSLATNWGLIIAKSIINKNDDDNIKIIYQNWETFLFHWTFSIYSMIRLHEYVLFDKEKFIKSTPPPTSIRIAMICDNIASILMTTHNFDKKRLKECVDSAVDAVYNAEKAFEQVSFGNNEFKKFTSVYTDSEQTAYLYEITSNWNKIRSKLEPFALGELPPLKK